MTTERIILALLLAGVAYGCGIVLWPFLSTILWGAILTFATWPLFKRLRRRMRPAFAAVIMMVCSAIAIVVPLALLTSTGLSDLPRLIEGLNTELESLGHGPGPPAWITSLPGIGPQLLHGWQHWNHDVRDLGEALHPYAGQIAHFAFGVLVQMASGIAELVMALFIALFFWISGDSLGRMITAVLTRITGNYAERLITIIGGVIRGTVYGILGTAIVQGVLTAVGLWISGVPAPVLLGGVAAFVAVFPVGAPLIWAPAAIWLAMHHHLGWGLFLAGYGIVFISGADHTIRPAFIARGAQLPYLLTVLGVLGGVVTIGGLGIFLGPVLLGVGYTLTTEFARGAYQNEKNTTP